MTSEGSASDLVSVLKALTRDTAPILVSSIVPKVSLNTHLFNLARGRSNLHHITKLCIEVLNPMICTNATPVKPGLTTSRSLTARAGNDQSQSHCNKV